MEPLYLDSEGRRLFCVRYAVADAARAVLVLPPFAEEMNKCRRMVALTARALCAAGHSVLVPDMFGTGDSEGDFSEARWDHWLADAVTCIRLLRSSASSVDVLALRSGALLVAEMTRDLPHGARLVLWQPVTQGKVYANQFLRLRLIGDLVASGEPGSDAGALRDELDREGSLEIAGYRVSATLLRDLEARQLTSLQAQAFDKIACFEVGFGAGGAVSPALQRVIEQWRKTSETRIHAETVSGQPFWGTVEIAVVPTLVDATVRAFTANISAEHA